MLPVYRVHQRSTRIVFLPKSRSSWIAVLLLGTVTLYFFYQLSFQDSRWDSFSFRPRPPPPAHFPGPPFDNFHPPDSDPPHSPHKPPPVATPDSTTRPASDLWKARAADVKASFLHAWNAYDQYAWGHDELLPLSTRPSKIFNGWGVSIVDALDTLLIMDLRPQYTHAMEHVASMNFSQTPNEMAPFFETTIRYLGGLLSAYALVKDDGLTSALTWKPELPPSQPSSQSALAQERQRIAEILLSKADHLGRHLLPVFNTSSGLPAYAVNTVSGTRSGSFSALLAEIGSCQMEYKYLAHLTGHRDYFDAVDKVSSILEKLQQEQLHTKSVLGGMLPTHYSVPSGKSIDDFISVGAMADSTYEYFLKGYLLSNRSEPQLLDMYLASVDTALRNLTYISDNRGLVYVGTAYGTATTFKMEHLACFYPGLLSLGVELLSTSADKGTERVELTPALKERHFWAAQAIAETCWVMYADNPTGLGSEEVLFDRPLVPVPSKPKFDGLPPTIRYAPVAHSYGRWWDAVNKWESDGRPDAKVPGVHHDQRKVVVTNGGKGSWETFGIGTPSGNETPYNSSDTQENDGQRESRPTGPHQRPPLMRTHLRDYHVRDNRWLMRPETIESLYLLHRSTRDPIWRDRCYSIYQAMEKYSRAETGYTSIGNVDAAYSASSASSASYGRKDDMPSYALAETFKYLYLCMLEPEDSAQLLPSNKWIFNTEAHPLPVFDWTETELNTWVRRQ